MLRAGTITKEMAAAADRFRIAFRIAHLDALRAADMARTPGTGGRPDEPPIWAKRHVSDVVTRLGGQGSLVASCLWHVIGLEWSIRRWCREQAGIAHSTGAGILIAALVILAAKSGRRSAA